jgi:high-affinity iron transporter
MFATFVIAFREFLEVFLIIGLFWGVSKKLTLKKEKEIALAGGVGIILSLILISCTYIFGDYARTVLTERNADALESYLLMFSGVFIIYVVFSLHKILNEKSHKVLIKTKEKMQQNVFDFSLFLTIVFLIVREGFEIALFTATTSLFASFIQNFIGLILGLGVASLVGFLTSVAYRKISIKKVFQFTEYFIILLGASLFQTGLTTFLDTHFNISLSDLVSFHLSFLPNEDTFIGGFLQNFLGVDSEFSLVRLGVMAIYIFVVYLLFIKPKSQPVVNKIKN